jgi:hypothetical protein
MSPDAKLAGRAPEHAPLSITNAPRFSFTTTFSNDDLATFYATGTNIVVAKSASTSQTPNVAWIVYRPFPTNYVSWVEQYGLYASNVEIVDGNLIMFNAVANPIASVAPDVLYTLSATGAITGPTTSGGTAGAYSMNNQYSNTKRYLTFGLNGTATVDGTVLAASPITATTVLYQSTGVMPPNAAIWLWVQSGVGSGTIVNPIPGPVSIFPLSGSGGAGHLTYVASSGTFVVA